MTLSLLALISISSAAEVDLRGSWALQITTIVAAKVPVIGDIRSTTYTRVLIDLEEAEGQWTARHRVCETKTGGKIVKTVIPPEYIAAIPTRTYPVSVKQKDGKTTFDADTVPFTIGYDPAMCTQPPEDPSAACVVDSDNDGHPGVTVRVRPPFFAWNEIYLAQAAHTLLHGSAVSADEISGGVESRHAISKVLGATRSIFNRSPTSRVLQDECSFKMTRLPPGSTCAGIDWND